MRLRAVLVALAVLVATAAVPVADAAALPRGYKGTIELIHRGQPVAGPEVQVTGDFLYRGVYRVAGRVKRIPGGDPFYPLTGSGSNDLRLDTTWAYSNATGEMHINGSGPLRLRRRDPIYLSHYRGRFFLSFHSLDKDDYATPGFPIDVRGQRDNRSPCDDPEDGTKHDRLSYVNGVYLEEEIDSCGSPNEPYSEGRPRRHTIWPVQTWAPDVVPSRVRPHVLCPVSLKTFRDKEACARHRGRGRIRATIRSPRGRGWNFRGTACPFWPNGTLELGTDPFEFLCDVSQLYDWNRRMTVKVDLRPVR